MDFKARFGTREEMTRRLGDLQRGVQNGVLLCCGEMRSKSLGCLIQYGIEVRDVETRLLCVLIRGERISKFLMSWMEVNQGDSFGNPTWSYRRLGYCEHIAKRGHIINCTYM
jgi:hypothetical protein